MMSAFLNGLKLVAATKQQSLPPIVQKRNKLIKRLHEQLEYATALAEGREYVVTRMRKVKDEATQTTTTVSQPKRVKAWWFAAANGKLCISVRYGAKVLALSAKGANAIELNSADELITTLGKIKAATEAGELDTAIEGAVSAVQRGFTKTKK